MLHRLFVALLASLFFCICHAWTLPLARKMKKNPFSLQTNNKAKAKTTTRSVPPPPWTFQASRIHYTFLAIPTHVAQRYSPSAAASLTLLSVPPGYTLGGVFCVEYTDSPIGPYREVAILSSLVGNLGGMGAWASHIFVNNEQAAQYGQAFWGLPAETVEIVNDDDTASSIDDSVGLHVNFGKNKITWTGWDKEKGDSTTTTTTKPMEWFNVSLPSFSGCLPLLIEDESDSNTTSETTTSPLLRYPLRIVQPHGFSLSTTPSSSSHIRFALDDAPSSSTSMQQVKEILTSSRPLASINVNNVQLQAGIPVPI